MKKKTGFRKIINVIHLWIGIPSALILFVVCLSGTTYVFQKEITRWVDSDKFNIAPAEGAKLMPVAELVAILEKDKKGLKVTGIQVPESNKEAWMFTMAPKENKGEKEGRKGMKEMSGQTNQQAIAKNETADKTKDTKKNGPAEKGRAGGKERNKNFLINPYTGHIQGDAQTTTSNFFNTVMQLHRWLLMDHEIGSVITGVAAFCFVMLEITGLVLWVPAKVKKWKAWKPGFSVKLKAGWKRVNHDWHKAIGFYTFLLITVMGLTGPVMGFEWYKEGFAKAFGAKAPKKGAPGPSSVVPLPGTNALTAEELLAKAAIAYPYPADIRINFPKDSTGSVAIAKTKNGFFASAATDRIVLDQYTGNTLKLERFSDKKTGEKIVSLVKAIHTGEVFGLFSKILYFIACLTATSLPVTGVIIWLNKRKKTKSPKFVKVSAMGENVAVVNG